MKEGHRHPDGEDGVLLSKALTRAQSIVARVAELLAHPEVDEAKHSGEEAIEKRGVAIEQSHEDDAKHLSRIDHHAKRPQIKRLVLGETCHPSMGRWCEFAHKERQKQRNDDDGENLGENLAEKSPER